MSYQINRFNGTVLTEVPDQTVDSTSCDLKLIGRNYAGYGELHNENFLFLLENFRSLTAPRRPIVGQLWYDETSNKIKYRDSSNSWRGLSVTEVNDIPPTGFLERDAGNLWFDSFNKQISIWDGSEYVLIGPERAPGFGKTRLSSEVIRDNGNTAKPIIKVYANNNVIATLSDSEYQIGSFDSIPGFTQIKKGITLVNTDSTSVTSTDFRFWGTAGNTERFNGLSIDKFVLRDPAGSLFADSGFFVGNGNDLSVFIENGNQPVISNQSGTEIKIRIVDNDADSNYIFNDAALYPLDDNQLNLGLPSSRWGVIYSREVRANLLGDVVGNVIGNVQGNTTGMHRGGIMADDSTSAYNAVTKTFVGNFVGNVNGTISGNVAGATQGVHTGSILANDGSTAYNADSKIFTGILVGNATSASALSSTARINGVIFDGTTNITIIDDTRLSKAGGVITNDLTVNGSLKAIQTPVAATDVTNKLYVDSFVQQYSNTFYTAKPLIFSLDTRGLTNNTIATLLNTLAPPGLYFPGQEARIAGTRQNLALSSVKTPTTESVSSTDENGNVTTTTYVTGQSLTVTSTVSNPTRNNNLLFRVSSNGATWEYISG